MSYLGVDIGTSCCKAAAFDDDGRPLAGARRAYSIKSPAPGHMELDSKEVIDRCLEVIAEAAAKAGDPVIALAVSSQGEAFTPIDAQGDCLANAMISSDSRAAVLVERFTAEFGAERLYEITGHTPSPLFTLFKMLWLKRERPDVWRRAERFLCFEDLLLWRLGIEPAMGWPLAGRTMLFDVRRHRWSPELLEALELDAAKLARPLPSGAVVGEIPDEVASGLCLPTGVKVATGGHDQTIAALGAGVRMEGEAMYAAGTVECLCPVFANPVLSPELRRANLCCYDYSLPDRYCSVAYSLTGSNLLQYLLEQFGRHELELAKGEANTAYKLLLDALPTEPTSLLALPYLTPSGTPYFDSLTPGAVFGLRLSTSRGEFLKALLEAVGFEMKLNLALLADAGIKAKRLLATGGGLRDTRLLQLKADILDMPITRIEVDEAGCLGAARLAAAALGVTLGTPDVHSATAAPNPERAERYQVKFRQYQELYAGLKPLATKLFGGSPP